MTKRAIQNQAARHVRGRVARRAPFRLTRRRQARWPVVFDPSHSPLIVPGKVCIHFFPGGVTSGDSGLLFFLGE